MNLDRFAAERGVLWRELDTITRRAKGRVERLDPRDLLRLGHLYRAAAADLAYARRRWPGDPIVTHLDHLANRARVLVYDAPPARGGVRDFLAHDYWRRVVERPGMLLVAAVLLFTPLVLSWVWAGGDPGAATALVPSGYESVTEPRAPGQDLGMSAGEEAAFSSLIFTNNIRVTFLAFAAGTLLGVGTALVLGYNGIFIGALTGLAFHAGNGLPFTELVVAHGVLELSCIVVTGAAGLRLGWAIVAPGYRRRIDAVIDEGRKGVEIVLGTMPWLVLAGVVEGFVTPAGLGIVVNSAVGVALGGAFWALAIVRGGSDRDEVRGRSKVQSRALALARR